MSDRLDRIEDILFSVSQRLDQTSQRLDQIAEQQQRNTVVITELSEDVRQTQQTANDAVQMVIDLGDYFRGQVEQAEQDRSQAAIDRAEFRSTVQGILEALTQRFNSNGHSE